MVYKQRLMARICFITSCACILTIPFIILMIYFLGENHCGDYNLNPTQNVTLSPTSSPISISDQIIWLRGSSGGGSSGGGRSSGGGKSGGKSGGSGTVIYVTYFHYYHDKPCNS